MLRSARIFLAFFLVLLASCGAPSGSIGAASLPPTSASAAPASPPAKAADPLTVSIDNFTFSPKTLIVPVGAKVTFVNHDDIPHTVMSTEKKFKSGTLDTDDSYSFQFTEPGTYPYFCTIHAHMTGEIIVKKGE